MRFLYQDSLSWNAGYIPGRLRIGSYPASDIRRASVCKGEVRLLLPSGREKPYFETPSGKRIELEVEGLIPHIVFDEVLQGPTCLPGSASPARGQADNEGLMR